MRYLALLTLFLILALQQSVFAAVGDIVDQYNFEDGRVPDPGATAWWQNAVPAQVLSEANGNHFLRITASPTDCGNAFNTSCPTVREELHVADVNWTASDSNPTTYCTSLRIPSSNPAIGDNLAQVYFYSGANPIPGTWAVALWDNLGIATRPSNLDPDWRFPNFPYNEWHTACMTIFFSYSAGWIDTYWDGVYQTRLTPRDTIYVSGTPNLAQLWINVYGGAGTADFDNIKIQKGTYNAQPSASVDSISPSTINKGPLVAQPNASVDSISPSTINLVSPPSTVTVTGTGFANQGFGLPYVNFYTVPGDVRLLDAPAISGTNTALVQTFNPALFSAGTYRAKVWLRPSSSTWTLAGSVDFTVTSTPLSPNTVTWSNDRGGSGTATGTTNWSISNIPLQPGVNNITVTATDAQGLSSTDNIAVTY